MSTTVLQRLRYNGMRKSWTNFQGRVSTSKGFYNSIQSRQMEEVRSKRLFDRKRKKRKNIFLLTTGTVVQRTMLHTYVATALYEPSVLTIEPDAFYNRYSMGSTDDLLVTPEYSVVIMRSLLCALNIYRMALRGMVLRFTGQRL